MRESVVEKKLRDTVRQRGGLCWKFTSPGVAGVPDRLVILPGGHIAFVEVKAPGQRPRPSQVRRINQLRDLEVPVLVIDQPNQIGEVLDALA